MARHDDVIRRGVGGERAVAGLRHLIDTGRGVPLTTPDTYVNPYLSWVENVEVTLSSLFVDPPIDREVLTGRYWKIREQGVDDPRPLPLVTSERDRLVRYLDGLKVQLEREIAGFDEASYALVVDTNVFLHCRPLDQLNWNGLANATKVRLVVLLAVLDELDTKTYGESDKLAKRAKTALRLIDRQRSGATRPEQPVHVRPGVELQILPDPRGHERYANTDDEIIRRAEHVASLTDDRSSIVSGDRGMRIRAQARDLECLTPPTDWGLEAEPAAAEDPDGQLA